MIPLIAITRRRRPGFALPSVLIASVVMMIVLVTAAAAVSTARSALNSQYYNQLAKEAAESGIAMAEECIHGGITSWPDPLRPGSTCTGAGSQCSSSSCYLIDDTDNSVRTTFAVTVAGSGADISLTATGTAERLRPTDGSVWDSFTQVLHANVGSELLATTSISSGSYSVCAVISAHTWCSGANQSGQMGNGRVESRSEKVYYVPERVMRQPGVLFGKKDKFVRSGDQAVCTVTTDDEIYCWGRAAYGMLGTGSIPAGSNQPFPTRVEKPAEMTGEVTDLAIGYRGTCAIAGGDVWCWGRDHLGQTGVGGTDRSSKYLPVKTAVIGASRGIPATDIASHIDAYYFCAVAGGEVYCWGDNEVGQLGDGTTTTRTEPALVTQAAGALQGKTVTKVELSAARYTMNRGHCDTNPTDRDCYDQTHACVATSDGEMYCWGTNHYGQLGQGSWGHTVQTSPVRVLGRLDGAFVRDIALSFHTSCALTTEPDTGDRFYCWGSNWVGAGAIGDNRMCENDGGSSQQICSPYPVAMETPGLEDKHIDSISAGVNRTCAITEGTSYCSGWNGEGQLGDGTTLRRYSPVEAKLFRQYRTLLVY